MKSRRLPIGRPQSRVTSLLMSVLTGSDAFESAPVNNGYQLAAHFDESEPLEP